MELKTLDLKTKEFAANGKQYFIADKISIDRYAEYQKLMPLLTFGVNFEEMYKQLKNAYNHLNAQKFADSSVIIHNLLSNVATVEQSSRVHPALKMAALFINTKDEDVREFNEQLTEEKIKDWTLEGYSISDFFTLSLNSISGFREAFQEYTEKNVKINGSTI